MSFKKNILKKIKIEALRKRVAASLKITDSGRRIDRSIMRTMLAMIPSSPEIVRDLEIYRLPLSSESDQSPQFLVLDNELPIYRTDIADIALRRSPTLKEMLNIRNAIKILNDKSVVLSKTHDSLQWVVDYLVSGLDLRHTIEDLRQIADEGRLAFKIQDPEGVEEALMIFADLLGLLPPPPSMRLAHHTLWGKVKQAAGKTSYGPLVCYGPHDQTLVMVMNPIVTDGPGKNQAVRDIAGGRLAPDVSGPDVFTKLTQWVGDDNTQPSHQDPDHR